VPAAERRQRGEELFATVYGPHTGAVRERLQSFHRAFDDFVVEAAYGRILCRPGLPCRTRELLAAAALCSLQQWPQFVAHARGALAFGADRRELREVVHSVLDDENAADERMQRI
jgi:4-carboxymuconolactone decarboxylase